MNQFIRPVQITPEAHLIQSFWKQPGAPVGVHINTMVLASREPVVFDTGVPPTKTAGSPPSVRSSIRKMSAGSCSATTTTTTPATS